MIALNAGSQELKDILSSSSLSLLSLLFSLTLLSLLLLSSLDLFLTNFFLLSTWSSALFLFLPQSQCLFTFHIHVLAVPNKAQDNVKVQIEDYSYSQILFLLSCFCCSRADEAFQVCFLKLFSFCSDCVCTKFLIFSFLWMFLVCK